MDQERGQDRRVLKGSVMERVGRSATWRGFRRTGFGASGWALMHLLAALAIVAGLAVAGWAFATTYVYDANGRLVVATNDAGQSARYVYDVMGNLAEVQRLGPDDLAVFAFSPTRGAPGAQVRIQGHGFAPDPAGNALSFNGAPAQIEAAAFNELTAIVPAGATTGPLTVEVGGQIASSATPFVVDESLRPPVIHSVSPLIGAVGTPITVDGASLQPVVGQTTIRLNLRPALPTTVTDTQVVFPIPAVTGSGKVTVGTSYGTATSQQDVVVVPGSVDPALVAQAKRLEVDAPAEQLAIASTGEYVAVLFDAVAGDYLAGQFAQLAGNVAYTLYDPVNRQLGTGTATATNPTALLPVLPATGTYLLLLKPAAGPATWALRIERAAAVASDGDVIEAATATPGQRVRKTFNASAGQHLGLGISDLV
ncbi:IPT/TIG domain-containing protein, partial [Luteimonas huabeiensis]|uniref:IPT/TIG domain-containing protein n=1 Tax=Luteimonas huabeiensis TaxID=1244513 RepID=UPI00191C401D